MNKVIILLGPTSVGKTGAAILVAEALGTEIISTDSMQIYRHMDIGTAKPTGDERSRVKHHIMDIVEPSEDYSTGRFIEDVTPLIELLHAEGRIPLVVGGTGLYIKAMTQGLFSGPSADWSLREELLSEEEESPGALYERLVKADPVAAASIEPNDTRRVIRALEVCVKEGSMTEMRRQTAPLPYDFIKIGITREREELYRMIESRVDEMFTAGLVDEVKRLLAMNPSRVPMQAIGYKEVAAYLSGEYSLSDARRLIKRNTRRYAKRQFTWFKKEEGILWLDVTGIYDSRRIYELVMAALKRKGIGLEKAAEA